MDDVKTEQEVIVINTRQGFWTGKGFTRQLADAKPYYDGDEQLCYAHIQDIEQKHITKAWPLFVTRTVRPAATPSDQHP